MLTAGRHGLSNRPERGPASWWAMDAGDTDGAERPLVGLIADAYRFEPDFFGMSERDAEWTDPQQRLLLMCAYAALESAGHPQPAGARIGVYVGGEFPSYIANVQPEVRSSGEFLQALLGNDKDFLASRLAYRLDLTGGPNGTDRLLHRPGSGAPGPSGAAARRVRHGAGRRRLSAVPAGGGQPARTWPDLLS